MSFFLIKMSCFFFFIFLRLNIKSGMFVNNDFLETMKDGRNAIIIMIYAPIIGSTKMHHRVCMSTYTRISVLFACIFAVNITQRLRQSYKIGECAAKYRLSFTKIKYSEQQERERRIRRWNRIL